MGSYIWKQVLIAHAAVDDAETAVRETDDESHI